MIKAPYWAKDAHPTNLGWVSKHNNGEVLCCRKHTAEQIAEWHGTKAPVKPAPNLETEIDISVEEVPKIRTEAPHTKSYWLYLRGLIRKVTNGFHRP